MIGEYSPECDKMFSVMAKEDKPVAQPKISAEYHAIDADYRRKVALVNARPKLELGALGVWLAFDVLMLLVLLFGVVLYIVAGSFVDARMSASILDNVASSQAGVTRAAPAPLDVSDAKSASVVAAKYDFYATIENFNQDWYATFDYVFTYDGGVTVAQPGFVNPAEKRTLAAINESLERRPASVQMTLENFVWHRVDRHAIPDTAQFLTDHANITVDESTYSKDVTLGEDQFGRSSITLTNRTAYAYWEPEFLVKLMRGSTIVSLTKVTVPEFLANETRQVEVRWFGEVPPSGNMSIEPIIPYFESGVYMNPDDETGLDVRR